LFAQNHSHDHVESFGSSVLQKHSGFVQVQAMEKLPGGVSQVEKGVVGLHMSDYKPTVAGGGQSDIERLSAR
jgi:hypothetical protein